MGLIKKWQVEKSNTLGLINNLAEVKDGAITTAKIADSAVTTAKIANNAVTRAKIANGATNPDKTNFLWFSWSDYSVTIGAYSSKTLFIHPMPGGGTIKVYSWGWRSKDPSGVRTGYSVSWFYIPNPSVGETVISWSSTENFAYETSNPPSAPVHSASIGADRAWVIKIYNTDGVSVTVNLPWVVVAFE